MQEFTILCIGLTITFSVMVMMKSDSSGFEAIGNFLSILITGTFLLIITGIVTVVYK
jgi:hypothetical protein